MGTEVQFGEISPSHTTLVDVFDNRWERSTLKLGDIFDCSFDVRWLARLLLHFFVNARSKVDTTSWGSIERLCFHGRLLTYVVSNTCDVLSVEGSQVTGFERLLLRLSDFRFQRSAFLG